jgi:serine/threonine protein kinase
MAAAMEEYPELGLCASFKATSLQIVRDQEILVERSNAFLCQRQCLSAPLSSLDMHRNFLRYQREAETIDVVLESKPYHINQDLAYEIFVHKRVFEIAQLLAQTPKPKNFRTLDCLGYLQDRPRNRHCFVFRLPKGFNYTGTPLSLRNIYGDGSAAVANPPLGVRFQMALSASLSLLYMHACGIIHKAYRAENLLILRNEGESTLCLSSPTLLGFDFSRPHGDLFTSKSIAQLTTDPERLYVHPDYKPKGKGRYLKVYDLYCLGVMLLEIGMWESAGITIPANSPRRATHSASDGHKTLDGRHIRGCHSEMSHWRPS